LDSLKIEVGFVAAPSEKCARAYPKNLECSERVAEGRPQGGPAIIESPRSLWPPVGIDFSNHISAVEMLMRDRLEVTNLTFHQMDNQEERIIELESWQIHFYNIKLVLESNHFIWTTKSS